MVTLKDSQKSVNEWIEEKGSKWSAYADYCHLVEEVGELGEALVVKHGERVAGSGLVGNADHSDLDEEVGDSLFSLIAIANRFDIDLEACFERTLQRYDKKIERRNK